MSSLDTEEEKGEDRVEFYLSLVSENLPYPIGLSIRITDFEYRTYCLSQVCYVKILLCYLFETIVRESR